MHATHLSARRYCGRLSWLVLAAGSFLGTPSCDGADTASDVHVGEGGVAGAQGGESGAGPSGLAGDGGLAGSVPGLLSCTDEPVPTVEELLADTELRGQGEGAELVVYAFSQSNPSAVDPQLAALGPVVSLRTTGQWDTSGTRLEDYAVDEIAALQQSGSVVILGLTASVVFESQFENHEAFLEAVTRDASNEPVPHDEIVPGAYRGNLASVAFRDLVVKNAETLVDVGADGIFFDEVGAGYSGSNYDGNEGFDDAHQADLRRYLCATDPSWTPETFADAFGTGLDNTLDCAKSPCDRTGLNVRTYLQGVDLASVNPELIALWGQPVANRSNPEPTSFVETYNLVYWADIVRRVRQYAREQYGRELVITSNGLFPFVDLQSVGLYDWNVDGPNGTLAEYVPVDAEGHLDASASLLDIFDSLRERSRALAGNVPIALFIDWPTAMMDAYLGFSEQEKKDYFRIYGAEAYAAGLRFAWHLRTSILADPTAEESGMLDWFANESAFYRGHAEIYLGAEPSTVAVTGITSDVSARVTTLPSGAHAVHLINHAYQSGAGLQPHVALTVTVDLATTDTSAAVYAPEPEMASSVALTVEGDAVSFELPELTSYAVVVVQ